MEAVKPKTQEFLYFLLWTAEQLFRPTFRNLPDSYEQWIYRNGLHRQLAKLEKQELVELMAGVDNQRLCRLTEAGRLQALGGRDPEAQWARKWDGRWRLVVFDVPRKFNSRRDRLRRFLRGRAVGCLQGSLWVTPDPLTVERRLLEDEGANVRSLILFDAVPCAGERDAQIVSAAWDFIRINAAYGSYLEVLEQRPAGSVRDDAAARKLQLWGRAERESWQQAVWRDPLLPDRLLPEGYLGRRAWRRRIKALAEAGAQVVGFGK